MVDVIVNGNTLDLEDKAQNIKYSMQINDIFDLSTVNSSYTNSFSIQKNAHNTQVFKMLGLVADPSKIPYQKVEARLSHNGFPLIKSGWLKVTETSDTYKINIIDGIIDFFKAIDNKTVGRDLNLDEINHRKDLNTVTESFDNPYYKYIVAEYNGKTMSRTASGAGAYNIDYLVPSAKITYLWDKVFNTFGFTYSGSIFSDDDFTGSWLTYPKAPEASDVTEPVLVAGLEKLNFTETIDAPNMEFTANHNWNIQNIIEGSLLADWIYVIPSTQNYRVQVIPKGFIDIIRIVLVDLVVAYQVQVFRGTSLIMSVNTSSDIEIDESYDDYFYQGETLNFKIVVPQETEMHLVTQFRLNLENLKVNIYKLSFGEVSFSNALTELTIKDFVKEIIIRFGLTPVINNISKHITFYTLSERLDLDNAVDWSSKYVSRTKESYIQGAYAQQNVLRHKYNDAEETFSDGVLYVNNQNLEDTKDIYTSKLYSFDNRISSIGAFNSFYYPIWQPEPKEVTLEDGSVEIQTEYKGLSGRFYIMKLTVLNLPTPFVSDILGGEVEVESFPAVRADNTVYSQLIEKYYPDYNRILNDFRAHTITLALTINDILSLSFVRPYYFSQELNFYILNKVTWEEGKICTGEFIRLKKQ
jgi:hypothetical protein